MKKGGIAAALFIADVRINQVQATPRRLLRRKYGACRNPSIAQLSAQNAGGRVHE
jgi:hypothetical protein